MVMGRCEESIAWGRTHTMPRSRSMLVDKASAGTPRKTSLLKRSACSESLLEEYATPEAAPPTSRDCPDVKYSDVKLSLMRPPCFELGWARRLPPGSYPTRRACAHTAQTSSGASTKPLCWHRIARAAMLSVQQLTIIV